MEAEIELQTIRILGAVGGEQSALRLGHFTPGTDQMPIVQDAVWASGAGVIGHGKHHPHRDSNTAPPGP